MDRTRENHIAPHRRGFSSILGGILLNLAAIAGLICIVLVVLSMVFHISLIMFKTGSMSPTIPQGSLAVVREIPAAQIEVGDVVTVDRDGQLPITHRVTSVEGTGAERTITMRGDANQYADPAPYSVTEVRTVLWSISGLARIVIWFSNPFVLGALTIGASVLVTWAFWPHDAAQRRGGAGRRPESDDNLSAEHRDSTGSEGSADRVDDAESQSHATGAESVVRAPGAGRRADGERVADAGDKRGSEHSGRLGHQERPGRHARAMTFMVGAILAGGLTLTVAPTSAAHADVANADDTVTGDYISITTIGDEQAMTSLAPGVPVDWQVGVMIDSPTAGDAIIDLSTRGDLNLDVTIRACTVQWVGETCPGDETSVTDVASLTGDQSNIELLAMPTEEQRWLLFTVSLPVEGHGSMVADVRVTANGETVSDSSEASTLPRTGTDLWLPLSLAVGAIVVGLLIAGIAARSSRKP